MNVEYTDGIVRQLLHRLPMRLQCKRGQDCCITPIQTAIGDTLMATVTLDEAQAQLPKLLAQLQPGEELTITTQGQPLAQVKKVERTS